MAKTATVNVHIADLEPVKQRLEDAAREIEALRTVVRQLVEAFHEDTPMGPNVVDLPDVRWRILPPHVAGAVQRALTEDDL